MFPTKEAFNKQIEKKTMKAISWRDLEVDVIYKIEEKREVLNTKYGSALILHISNVNGNSIQVWATKLIAKTLMPDGKEEMKLPCFIRPLGPKTCKMDKSRSYYDFQILSAEAVNC